MAIKTSVTIMNRGEGMPLFRQAAAQQRDQAPLVFDHQNPHSASPRVACNPSLLAADPFRIVARVD